MGLADDGAGEGADATGALEELMALVSRSINFGWADLPAKKSDAVRAAWADAAGGKILPCQLGMLLFLVSGLNSSLLRLEALGFTGYDEADWLDRSTV